MVRGQVAPDHVGAAWWTPCPSLRPAGGARSRWPISPSCGWSSTTGAPSCTPCPLPLPSGPEQRRSNDGGPRRSSPICAPAARTGVIYDAVWEPEFSWAILQMLSRRRPLPGRRGRLSGVPTPRFRSVRERITVDTPPVPIAAEQSNSSVAFGDQAIVKFIRRFEEGVNPGVELGRFLGERAHFANAPATAGAIEYRSDGARIRTRHRRCARGVRAQRGQRLQLRGRRPGPRPRGGPGQPGLRGPPSDRAPRLLDVGAIKPGARQPAGGPPPGMGLAARGPYGRAPPGPDLGPRRPRPGPGADDGDRAPGALPRSTKPDQARVPAAGLDRRSLRMPAGGAGPRGRGGPAPRGS